MTQWKDATSYRRGEERIPRTWAAHCGPVMLVVMREHLHNPDRWTMHAHGLGIETFDLGIPASAPVEVAQNAAKNIAANKAREIAEALAALSN